MSGKPAHARTPSFSTDGFSRVSGSVAASSTITSACAATTYWQKLSSTGFSWSSRLWSSTPMQLFQNERRSSTTVTKASGVPSSVAARPESRSNGSSGRVSRSPLARAAASRAGARIAAGIGAFTQEPRSRRTACRAA